MASVSRVVLHEAGMVPRQEPIMEVSRALGALGHDVETHMLVDDGMGLSVAALRGLRVSRGDFILVEDASRSHSADDLERLLRPLIAGDAEIVVGSRRHRDRDADSLESLRGPNTASRLLGGALHGLIGTSDPWARLVGVTRPAARDADSDFAPIGSWYTLELLAKVEGPRVDVAVSSLPMNHLRSHRRLIRGAEIRHLKRLSDARFGNLSRLIQFCVVGFSGMIVDLTTYAVGMAALEHTALRGYTTPMFGGPLYVASARAIAILVAVTWNFALNRRLTFNDARGGSILRQYGRYLLGNALAVPLSFTMGVVLPAKFAFFGRHKLVAAVLGIVAATGVSFSMSRWVVFRHDQAAPPPPVLVDDPASA